MQRKTREIRPRKTRRKAEKFFEKGVAISYFACYNNTCVTATDMRWSGRLRLRHAGFSVEYVRFQTGRHNLIRWAAPTGVARGTMRWFLRRTGRTKKADQWFFMRVLWFYTDPKASRISQKWISGFYMASWWNTRASVHKNPRPPTKI